MSVISTRLSLIRWSSRSSGPSKIGRWTCHASGSRLRSESGRRRLSLPAGGRGATGGASAPALSGARERPSGFRPSAPAPVSSSSSGRSGSLTAPPRRPSGKPSGRPGAGSRARGRRAPRSMVSAARSRAFREPSTRMSSSVSRSRSAASRRRRIGSRQSIRISRQQPLVLDAADLRRPALARHPLLHLRGREQLVELVEVADLGAPGIAAPWRCGSVNICMHFWRISSGGSERLIALPYDFDIFRPSIPGTFAAGVNRPRGSGKTSP